MAPRLKTTGLLGGYHQLYQGHAEVWWCPEQQLDCVLPYEIVVLRNVGNTSTAKLPAQAFATSKRITPQKLRLMWESKREKVVRVLNHVTQR